eukprot:TRINITY_DN8876_c0_g1_i1.p1 TRINITY_DN8876_c0_g1~~TRINITY_DN8876_c0_g1_i1.p1  ORF type:complete len:433 (-),score=74.04 TRINITY_DN8876_c0_g1_i1:3-1277(-)
MNNGEIYTHKIRPPNLKDYYQNGKFKLTKELLSRIPCISSVSHTTYAVNQNNRLVSWGEHGSQGEVVEGFEDKIIVAISPSYASLLAVTNDNTVLFKNAKNDVITIFKPKERVICILNSEDYDFNNMYVVCEQSKVYEILHNKQVLLEQFLDKKINHVSVHRENSEIIFASLHNRLPEDDKVYFVKVNENSIKKSDYKYVIPQGVRIVNIFSSGGCGTFFHLDNGRIISFGSGGNGSRGRSNDEYFGYVGDDKLEDKPFYLACSMYYTTLISTPNENKPCELYGFGYNSNGELGFGQSDTNSKETPVLLNYCQNKIVGVYCGYFHCQLLVENENGERQIVGWGFNSDKQVKNDFANNYSPVFGKDGISHFLSNFVEYFVWSPQNHYLFSPLLKSVVLSYYLCIKRIKVKIPKFINFEIIKVFVN